MGDLFDGYRLDAAWDEVFDSNGVPHAGTSALYAALQALSAEDLDGRANALANAFRDQGITFDVSGEERPFPLDRSRA